MLSSSDQQRFGELRSLLQRQPGVGVWARLCRLVEDWGAEMFIERGLPYTLDHLRRWPDELRRAPRTWTDDLMAGGGEEHPWEMVRVLEVRALPLDEQVASGRSLLEGDKVLERLFELEILENLTQLSLTDIGITDEGCAALVSRRDVSGLRVLSMKGNNLSARGVSAIARCGYLGKLEALDLRANRWGGYEEAVAQLARTRYLRSLRRLDIECDLTPGDLDTLLTSELLAGLEHLGLEACFHQPAIEGDEFTDVDGLSLNREIALASLSSLSLANNMFMDEEVSEILGAPWIEQLRALDLEWNDIGDSGAEVIALTEGLRGLERLSLRGCQVGEKGAHYLARSAIDSGLGRLRALDISSTSGVPEDVDQETALRLMFQDMPTRYWVDVLADERGRWSELRELNMSDLNLELTAADIERLGSRPHLQSLELLELANVGMTPEVVECLLTGQDRFTSLVELNLNRNHDLQVSVASALSSLKLPSLKRLKLRECGLTDTDVDRISRTPGIEKLEMLDLRKNNLSKEAIETLLDSESLRYCHLIV